MGLSSLGRRRFRRDLVSMYKYLMHRSKDFTARHFTVVSSKLIRVYWQKIKENPRSLNLCQGRFRMGIRKNSCT